MVVIQHISSPGRMSSKVKQAARASHERREFQRASETPPSSNLNNSVESFPVSPQSARRTGSRGAQRPSSGRELPNPPTGQTARPPNSSPRSDISSPPRSTRSSVAQSSTGEDVGEEASVRFLKAKLTVLQQQVYTCLLDLNTKVDVHIVVYIPFRTFLRSFLDMCMYLGNTPQFRVIRPQTTVRRERGNEKGVDG